MTKITHWLALNCLAIAEVNLTGRENAQSWLSDGHCSQRVGVLIDDVGLKAQHMRVEMAGVARTDWNEALDTRT